MCTHLRYVRNKYTGRSVLVPCGKCPECIQRKADNRAFRIRNSIASDEMAVFVTLTYKNDYLPVVKRSDIKVGDVPIYRKFSPYNKNKFSQIGTIHLSSLPYGFDASKMRGINHYHDNRFVSVPFYRDIQNFLKRLRINLKRNNYELPFKYYACNELGPSTVRAHSHLVFVIKKGYFEILRSFIVKSWPFARDYITFNYVQPARNVASYVASYVNCDSRVPKLFQQTEFKPKHSYSKNFGISSPAFSLLVLRENVSKGSLEYNTRSLSKSAVTTSLVPQYVINRYFPLFKGYSRIPVGSLVDFLYRPYFYYQNSKYYDFVRQIDYSEDDIYKIQVSLLNHFVSYCLALYDPAKEIKYPSYYDFCLDFASFWRVYASSKLRMFYRSCEENLPTYPWASNYDNCNQVVCRPYICKRLGNLRLNLVRVCSESIFPMDDLIKYDNYNSLPQRVKINKENTARYFAMTKRRKTTNYVMSQLGHDV